MTSRLNHNSSLTATLKFMSQYLLKFCSWIHIFRLDYY